MDLSCLTPSELKEYRDTLAAVLELRAAQAKAEAEAAEETKKREAEAVAVEAERKARLDPNGNRFAALQQEGLARGNARALVEAEKTYGAGLVVGRLLRATAYAQRYDKNFTPEGVARVLRDVYHDPDTCALYEARMATRALSAGTPSEGGLLIAEAFSEEFIPLLYANSALFKLGMRSVPMPNGNLTMAGLASSSTATYGGENTDTNASQPGFLARSWAAKKLTAIVVISNDLLKSASYRADQIARDDAAMAVGLKMDSVGIQSQGLGYEPQGLKYQSGVNDLTINAEINADHPAKFFRRLLAANVPLSPGGKLGWLFNEDVWVCLYNLKSTTGQYYFREAMDRDELLGKPFQISQQIDTASNVTDMYYGDWSELICAQQSSMEFALSSEAAYRDSSGTMQAAFSMDQTVMRIIDRHDIAPRRPGCFVKCDDVQVANAA